MRQRMIRRVLVLGSVFTLGALLLVGCGRQEEPQDADNVAITEEIEAVSPIEEQEDDQAMELSVEGEVSASADTIEEDMNESEYIAEEPKEPAIISWNESWEYASYSALHSDAAVLYFAENGNGITVCVNAGHGAVGGESYTTQCHPDGSPKVTGGSTAEGSIYATAISSGMVFADGTPEAKVTIACALALKEELLSRGYNVLMVREDDDAQLDNIARTVMANNNADCHIAIHWDSSESDKGAFYIAVPDGSYKEMEPVRSHWQEHEALGSALIEGLRGNGVNIFSGGSMQVDLTQTSYSTIPSVDMEMGDKISDHSDTAMLVLAKGLADGIDNYFEQ